MSELDIKYSKDKLSPEELVSYRSRINGLSPEEISEMLQDAWMDNAYPVLEDTGRMADIKRAIDRKARPGRRIFSYAAAAAILVTVSVSTTLWFDFLRLSHDNVIVATETGEKSTLTLPDGTVVKLASSSRLSYNATRFGRKDRHVDFEGEGYFIVAKNPSRPFVVEGNEARVEVTGTKFLFIDGKSKHDVRLVLDEGSVNFSSRLDGKCLSMKAGETAVMDSMSGHVSIADEKPRLHFKNAELSTVLSALSAYYSVDIRIGDINAPSRFSGSLPESSLSESLDIIAKVYSAEFVIKDGSIVLNK